MRKFDYQHLPNSLFDGKVGDAHVRLFEDKGKLETLEQLHPEKLATLKQRALVDNVEASTRIEGLYVEPTRVHDLVEAALLDPAEEDATIAAAERAAEASASDATGQTVAQAEHHLFNNELEGQIIGYTRALRLIYEQYATLDLSTATILKLYEALFSYRDLGRKSRYRKKDYIYVQVDGHPQAMPVSPITAFETPLVLGGACDNLAESFNAQSCSPLVLAAVFTIDFLCIRPFDEGNGRVARLFANLLLEKAGMRVGHYMSIDRIIEESGMAYYDALNACVDKWDTGGNDYAPYVLYWFEVLHEAYEKLFAAVDLELRAGNSKAERVRLLAAQAKQPISKREILDTLGNVSEATVESVLGDMVKEGTLEKVGSGRSTKYLPR